MIPQEQVNFEIAKNTIQISEHGLKVALDARAISNLTYADRVKFITFGAGAAVTPDYPTMTHGFVAQVKACPQAIAAEYNGETITYAELDRRSTMLAHVLVQKGVQQGDTVCLYLERSIEMLIGMLASVKIGAAYAPQHFGVATETVLRHVSVKTGAKVILTLAKMAKDMPAEPAQHVIAVDAPIENPVHDALPVVSRPEDVCMVLFTSGTTGVPNGVRVTHGNMANIISTAPGNLGIRPGMKVGQILSIAFDMAAWESWGAMTNGGTLMIRGKSIQETAEKVDVLIATPSILASLDETRCRNVQAVAVAGEPCPRNLADKWGAFCNFNNSCGPTETTIVNTLMPHTPDKADLTIGKPTPNNTVYILDDDMTPLPIGEKGEMWAGGDCVTAGYLGNDTLNAERYRPDPFRPGHMMFRTRDLGQWTADGELLHHGRVDDQVKVRGFRVELDGVSAVLESVENCARACTIKFDSRSLVGFMSPADADTADALRRAQEKLPYYAVPARIIALDELPRTGRGKIDKKALASIAEAAFKQHN